MEEKSVLFWVILVIIGLVDIPFKVATVCLYTKGFNRRNNFRARIAGYVCILAAGILLVDLLYSSVLTNYMYSQIGTIMYILVQFFGLFLLFRDDWKKLVSVFVLVYLSTDLPYNIITLVYTCCGVDWTEDIPYMLLYLVTKLVLDLIYIFPLYYIYIKRIRGYLSGDVDGWIIVMLLYSIIITVVMNAFRETYVGMYNYNIKPINITLLAFIIVNSVFALFASYIYLKGRASAREKEVIRSMWQQDKARYEVSRENIAALNIKSHDLKHFLNKISAAGSDPSVLSDMDEARKVIQRYDSDIHTGNDALDVILSERSAYCAAHGITLKCMADGGALSGISGADIYTMFDNILSNSTEYLSSVEEEEKRICLIEVHRAKGMVHIHQENYFAGTLAKENGEIRTTKDDAAAHGYGLKSIRAVAEKYGGEMSVRTTGNLFMMDIMMMPSAPDQ